MVATLSGSATTPSLVTRKPRYATSGDAKVHFFRLQKSSALLSRSRTFFTAAQCSSMLSLCVYIKISSRYTTHRSSSMSDSARLMYAWKVAGAFVNPKGMTLYSKCPYRVRNAVFHSSPARIRMRWYASLRSSVVKNCAPWSRSKVSLMSGNGQRSLTVTEFSAR